MVKMIAHRELPGERLTPHRRSGGRRDRSFPWVIDETSYFTRSRGSANAVQLDQVPNFIWSLKRGHAADPVAKEPPRMGGGSEDVSLISERPSEAACCPVSVCALDCAAMGFNKAREFIGPKKVKLARCSAADVSGASCRYREPVGTDTSATARLADDREGGKGERRLHPYGIPHRLKPEPRTTVNLGAVSSLCPKISSISFGIGHSHRRFDVPGVR